MTLNITQANKIWHWINDINNKSLSLITKIFFFSLVVFPWNPFRTIIFRYLQNWPKKTENVKNPNFLDRAYKESLIVILWDGALLNNSPNRRWVTSNRFLLKAMRIKQMITGWNKLTQQKKKKKKKKKRGSGEIMRDRRFDLFVLHQVMTNTFAFVWSLQY